MKKKLLKFLNLIIQKLKELQTILSESHDEEVSYSSLSPTANGDENGHYSKALLWALKNRKKEDIKNIALTGQYGSGKSSILKTFQNNYKGKDLKFLNISLATFKEEKPKLDEHGNEIKTDKTELLRLIETSILEQIFYHEEDKKIPDSRFKKIKSYSQKKLFLFALGYSFFLLALYNYFKPTLIQDIFKGITISSTALMIIHYIGIIAIVLGAFFLIFKSIRVISAITINKLKIQNAEIGIGTNLSKSILNHHIDEILYFFSIRPYNVVIIEDLDRFQETEIFTKLREVNLLLNNSEKTRRKEIVFVYAVRDDMFTDKERTKFFDFIIPVIPVINSSNSSEILFKKKNEFNYKLSENLIEDLSFFIDDMRLLHNITNEFYLYKEKLNENLNQDKLFGIITYKNIYPNDFMKLSYNDGELYSLFNLKAEFIKNITDDIDTEVAQLKDEIKVFDKLYFNNIQNLRLLYIARIIEELPAFQSFVVNGQTLTIDEVIGDDHFQYIKTNNYSYNKLVINTYYNNESQQISSHNLKFSEISNKVDSDKSYGIREKEVIEFKNGKVNSLKNKIQELEAKRKKVRNYKFSELLRTRQIQELEVKNLNKNLIVVLLQNGYIAEDYIDYISLFHEESITRQDYQFHISIKNQIQLPYDYKLSKIEKLILKINPLDFESEFILNFALLDYLLAHSNTYQNQIDFVFNKLKDESKISVDFIKGYFEVSTTVEKLTSTICKKWNSIWGYVESAADFSDEWKTSLFKNIIEFSENDDINEIVLQSSFKQKILSDPLFLNITDKQAKLKSVIQKLNILFTKLDFENSPQEMLTFIYNKNYYVLNIEMITAVIKKFGEFNQVDFDNSNYYQIMSSKADNLIKYVNDNIDDYVENIYLKISSNKNEKEESYIALLNHNNLDFDLKVELISHVNTKVSKLSSVADSALYSHLLIDNKVSPTWENILEDYNNFNTDGDQSEHSIPQSSILFINKIQNAEELSKHKIPKEINTKNIYSVFWKTLIQDDDTEDDSYDLICKSSPWWYDDIAFENLSELKVRSLISKNCVNPTLKGYDAIKAHFQGLNIYLLEKRKNEYFKILDQLTFDNSDVELILKSTVLSNKEKQRIVDKCSEEVLTTSANLKLLAAILCTDNVFTVSQSVLELILTNEGTPVSDRLKLFIRCSDGFDNEFTKTILQKLKGNYAEITDKSIKAKIVNTTDNQKLLQILVNKNYISSFTEKDNEYKVHHKRK